MCVRARRVLPFLWLARPNFFLRRRLCTVTQTLLVLLAGLDTRQRGLPVLSFVRLVEDFVIVYFLRLRRVAIDQPFAVPISSGAINPLVPELLILVLRVDSLGVRFRGKTVRSTVLRLGGFGNQASRAFVVGRGRGCCGDHFVGVSRQRVAVKGLSSLTKPGKVGIASPQHTISKIYQADIENQVLLPASSKCDLRSEKGRFAFNPEPKRRSTVVFVVLGNAHGTGGGDEQFSSTVTYSNKTSSLPSTRIPQLIVYQLLHLSNAIAARNK